jgi:hypothetical protein
MSPRTVPGGIEIIDLGYRRIYVKRSTGFVLHHDDLTPAELLCIASDIASHDPAQRKVTKPGGASATSRARENGPAERTMLFS